MKYFIDTEFLEGTQKTWLGQSKPTIDLISIGIVCEDGREYYAISKDFNLKEAWNRYDLLEANTSKNHSLNNRKVYWIRDNVLKPIFIELVLNYHVKATNTYYKGLEIDKGAESFVVDTMFNYNNFRKFLKEYGKTNKQIAEEIVGFIYPEHEAAKIGYTTNQWIDRFLCLKSEAVYKNPQFYGYYSDYDWVVFCWLFGKMIDLPNGFPKYCIDLNQELERKAIEYFSREDAKHYLSEPLKEKLRLIKNFKDYPKQTNEHNALADARWNYELYKFLGKL